MAWDTDLVMMTRILVNDVGVTSKYADEYLRRVLICAGIFVIQEIELPYTYQFDINGLTINPDPTVNGDGVAQALLPLKAASILNMGQFQTAIGRAIKVRDGDSAIDTSVSFRGYKDILDLGPARAYEKLRWQIQASAGVGGAVAGPYRSPHDAPLDSIAWFYDEFASRMTMVGARSAAPA